MTITTDHVDAGHLDAQERVGHVEFLSSEQGCVSKDAEASVMGAAEICRTWPPRQVGVMSITFPLVG